MVDISGMESQHGRTSGPNLNYVDDSFDFLLRGLARPKYAESEIISAVEIWTTQVAAVP
jgi:hypothetical protein